MKRLILLSFVLFVSAKSWGTMGTLPDYKDKLWRSSVNCENIGWTQFSSAPIVIHQVDITSPSYSNSSVTVGRSTRESFLAQISTVAGPITAFAPTYKTPHWLDAYSSSYSYVNRFGSACSTIWWDWLDGIFANPTPADSDY